MIHTIRDMEVYEAQFSQQKNNIWFYNSICIGIVAEDNQCIFEENDIVLHEEGREVNYIFLMKGRKDGTKKVWYCLLVEKQNMEHFLFNTRSINYTEKIKNPFGIIFHISDLQKHGEIICYGKGKISRSNLKKNYKIDAKVVKIQCLTA
ncbi:hypothetical protein K6025_03470 [Ehrlichia sp. JZT12]